MTKTTNYQLNQWAKSDRIMMDDFNADNAKIDAALKANADAMPRIIHGSYTGDGVSSRTINLTFTPMAVWVSRSAGLYPSDGGAFFTQDYSITFQDWATQGKIIDSGFQVGSITYSGSKLTPDLNAENCEYHYLAIG